LQGFPGHPSLDSALNARLQSLDPARRRRRRLVETTDPSRPTRVLVDGKPCIAFCSNDYLGLSTHGEVIAAFREAALRGVGSGASHLVSGHGLEHEALEAELAEFTGRSRALVFSAGYMANLGIASALIERNDRVFEDRLNHASLLDAGLASGARFSRYPHGDPAGLLRQLARAAAAEGNSWILTDGVFSMDGDIAPLKDLAAAARDHGAFLIVDDAHGFGVLGPEGRGSVAAASLTGNDVPVLMGTLGKAIGTFGAFVAGSDTLIDALIQRARTYIYTTAMPPAVAAATRVALRVARTEEWRRNRLQQYIRRFRERAAELDLPVLPSDTPIQPVILGSDAAVLEASAILLEQGIFVGAIRPPTVPEGSARLRITFSAAHEEVDVDRLLTAIARIRRPDAT